MTSNANIIFISLIISLQLFIKNTTVGDQDINQEQDNYMCNMGFVEVEVSVAFSGGEYIVMIANLVDLKRIVKKRVAFWVYYTPRMNVRERTHPYYEAKKWDLLIDSFDKLNQISYIFSTTNMENIFYNSSDNTDQTTNQMHYLISNSTENGNEFIVKALEINTDKPSDHLEPTFTLLNTKIVYKSSEPDTDETGFLNLKLIYHHFPEGVHINGLVILERKVSNQMSHPIYHAVVYTTEKTPEGTDFNARHYLKGVPEVYGLNPEVIYFTRLEWMFDNKIYDKKSNTNSTCQDKESQRVTALAHVFTEYANGYHNYTILEYYRLSHRYFHIAIDDQGNIQTYESIDSIDNIAFIWCQKHPVSELLESSDCKLNPEFNQNNGNESYQYEYESDDNINGFSQTFWLILAVIATIVAILLLIAFEIFTIVSDK